MWWTYMHVQVVLVLETRLKIGVGEDVAVQAVWQVRTLVPDQVGSFDGKNETEVNGVGGARS